MANRESCVLLTVIIIGSLAFFGGILYLPAAAVADNARKSDYTFTYCTNCTEPIVDTAGAYYKGSVNCDYIVGNSTKEVILNYPAIVPWEGEKTQADVNSWIAAVTSSNSNICYVNDYGENTDGYTVKPNMVGWYFFLVVWSLITLSFIVCIIMLIISVVR